MAMLNNQRVDDLGIYPIFRESHKNRYCNYTLMIFIDFLMESQ